MTLRRQDSARSSARKSGIGAFLAGVSGVAMAFSASPASAQDAAATTNSDEIVVTAQRRETALQDTPVAVTAYTGEQLEAQGTTRLQDLATFTPGVVAKAGQSTTTALTLVVRGQSQTDILATLDPSVGTYVDGVYWARAYGLAGELMDVSSAQVLRGPQGTLFGRNTSGGAFLITTNAPDLNEFSAEMHGTIGDYDLFGGGGVVNLPIAEDVAALRIAFQGLSREGSLTNVVTGEDTNQIDNFTGRVRLLVEPTQNLSLLFNYETYTTGSLNNARRTMAAGPGLFQTFAGGATAANNFIASPENNGLDFVSNNTRSDSNADTETFSIDASWNVGFGELQFIAAHREVESSALMDLDGSRFAVYETFGEQDLEQTSYELQFNGEAFDARLDYVLGAMLFEESGMDRSTTYLGPSRPATSPFLRSRHEGHIDNQAVGYYAHGTFAVTDALNLTAGYRWSEEEKGIVTYGTNLNEVSGVTTCAIAGLTAPVCANPQTNTFSGDSYTIGADYSISDDLMVYIKRSTGFRSGGQQLRVAVGATQPFQPEEASENEIGLRSEWFDGRLRANISAYRTTIENVQRSTLITFALPGGGAGSATVLGNAAEMEVTGGEVEVFARLTDNLTLGANAALTDPDYVSYRDASGDRSNERFADVPDFMYSVSAAWEQPVSFGEVSLRADYAWTDEMALQNSLIFINETTRPAGGVLNVRAAVDWGDNVEFAIFGRNVTDNRDLVQALTLPAPLNYVVGIYREPMMVGASLKVRFND